MNRPTALSKAKGLWSVPLERIGHVQLGLGMRGRFSVRHVGYRIWGRKHPLKFVSLGSGKTWDEAFDNAQKNISASITGLVKQ